ncbi:MAG: hypothetical protein Q4A34_00080 [Candidatus Saccharibacteria bacterium]|nr:hypothetical protein [Candidatus Saccharibacteria bacterium]
MTAKQQPEQSVQPQYAPQPDPNAQYGPAPQPANTPYQQQPVNQQYFAQPQAAPVQYVIQAESLKGLKGWLMFYVVIFVLFAITGLALFFQSMTESIGAAEVISMIFGPIVAAASITAVVLISMNKAIGKWAAIANIAVFTTWSVIASIVSYASPATTTYEYDMITSSSASSASSVLMLIFSIIITIFFGVLHALYFINSRRVKETLVN